MYDICNKYYIILFHYIEHFYLFTHTIPFYSFRSLLLPIFVSLRQKMACKAGAQKFSKFIRKQSFVFIFDGVDALQEKVALHRLYNATDWPSSMFVATIRSNFYVSTYEALQCLAPRTTPSFLADDTFHMEDQELHTDAKRSKTELHANAKLRDNNNLGVHGVGVPGRGGLEHVDESMTELSRLTTPRINHRAVVVLHFVPFDDRQQHNMISTFAALSHDEASDALHFDARHYQKNIAKLGNNLVALCTNPLMLHILLIALPFLLGGSDSPLRIAPATKAPTAKPGKKDGAHVVGSLRLNPEDLACSYSLSPERRYASPLTSPALNTLTPIPSAY